MFKDIVSNEERGTDERIKGTLLEPTQEKNDEFPF